MSGADKVLIKGGRVIDPASGYDRVCDVFIADGSIVALGDRPDGFRQDTTIDAQHRVVCPGLIDLSARLREPGLEHKATIESESTAAASAGITTLCCPPDTAPVIDTPAVAELIERRAQLVGKVRVLPIGALTQGLQGEQLSEMAALKEAGCVAVGNGIAPIRSTLVQRRAMEYAATHSLRVFLHPEDPWLQNGGCVHEGAVSCRLGMPGVPESAETVAVARDLALVEQTGVRAHFCRLSTARAARMVARAQYDGLPVTVDVSAHHLHLTEEDVADFDSNAHVIPPLRTAEDRDALRKALAAGTINAITSDHQPHEEDAKEAPFPATAPGVSGMETLLPLALELVDAGQLPLAACLAALTCRPAQVLDIDGGTLEPGARADICIFDPQRRWTLDSDTLVSRGHNSPFIGQEFKGRVTHTLLNGEIVHALGQ